MRVIMSQVPESAHDRADSRCDAMLLHDVDTVADMTKADGRWLGIERVVQ